MSDIHVPYSYTSAYPVIALFALGQNRLMAVCMALLNAVLIASVIRFEKTWVRNLLNYLLYTIVILWAHYKLEVASRELNILRDRLKVQARAAQKAQARERVAADSRKRLYGHISREVRGLMSTALLAAQNMQVNGLFAPDDIEFTALEASLNGMSKILYDMLDFNRIEAGRFELVSKPYAFHKVIKGALAPLQMATQARGQELITELDPQIDVMARTALYRAKTMSEERIAQLLQEDDEDAALILGDEHRLKQLVTNLGSNACKFTPSGGKITIRTKILPRFGALDNGTTTGGDESPTSVKPSRDANHDGRSPLGNDNGFQAANPHSSTDTEPSSLADERLTAFERRGRSCEDQMVVRIEVEDTGVGIRRQYMIDNKLFSPYVQPDWGRFHGCGGMGFGLALSKEIVSLSGGRLGVNSKLGRGSMFWVELAVGIGQKILANSGFQQPRPASGSSAAEHRPSPPFSPPLNVLVVDDDALTRKLMARMLTRNGCGVETVDNGKSALDMFTCDSASPPTGVEPDENAVNTMGSKYDVIFLDKQMPVMSGVDTIKQLREMKRKDFVVGVTGKQLKDDQEEYLEAGVDVYVLFRYWLALELADLGMVHRRVLTKPVTEADLRKCLFSANERRKQAAAEGQGRISDAPSALRPDPLPSGPS
ncbi:hypothetical protein FRC01_006537 [Tulasnella sp. 417]|nr:hypothetical protein FRC01_006537 [Tulasnella sp. 417]